MILVGSLGRGGAERQAALTAVALSEAGAEVELFVSQPPLHLAAQLTPSVRASLPDATPTNRAQCVGRLIRELAAFRPDVVVSFLSSATALHLLARSLSARAREPAWVVAERGNLVLSGILGFPAHASLQLGARRMADRIAVNSASLAANLFAFDRSLVDKIEIVDNIFVPFERCAEPRAALLAEFGLPADAVIVGSVGSFQVDRNYALLARAWPRVRELHPTARLVVFGRTAGRECARSAEAFAREIGEEALGHRVFVAGERAEVRALMSGFDVLAAPSMLEGSSNALVEALWSGVPIAATGAADNALLARDAAVISRGWTASAVAAAIDEALRRGDELRVAARDRGREIGAERTPARVAARWLELLGQARAAKHERRRS